MTSLKTPLRYPGGKSRAIKKLSPSLLESFSDFREPFLGGGSMALHITQTRPNASVWVNDAYYNLYNFWVQLRDNGGKLHQELVKIKQPIIYASKPLRKKKVPKSEWEPKIHLMIDKHRELFNNAKSNISSETCDLTRAVQFYILNKCSFSGLGESSSFSEQASEQNFNMTGINKLPEYSKLIKKWKITNHDYADVMNSPGKDCFVFLDPPYDIKDDLYGKNGNMHSGFNHMRFYEDVVQCPHNWMITYNSNEVLKKRFSDYFFNDWDLTYTMRSSKVYTEAQRDRKELLITNYERKNSNA
tara:strand:- start:2757 stop:3659 length:903 start_codon:yes stop_codon:yes gene_type:complete